ncbi:hypothetical protein BJ875DRAFT_385931 [Amylocarpus encephaloides]|uniref:Uncharacterized protein n=1 Tax=Amylocarpus encephaloides TaxID=45428 RepID=A0A9P7YAC1_9HELO|nr:hypothetical protein BJ875DRAFT_385931 [Amylocarpus encephaloides]
MTSQRLSNLNRSEWNKKCRERLSEHLNDRLGITIDPSQVRLKTSPDDVYVWERLSEKEHLFSKNISDHLIGALKELYQEVGLSIEAVVKNKLREHTTGSVPITVHCPKGGVSFSSRIHELQTRLEMQTSELEQWQQRAQSEVEMRRQTELKINELQINIQEAQKDRERLGVDVQEWRLLAEQCQARTKKYSQALQKVSAYLEDTRPELDG